MEDLMIIHKSQDKINESDFESSKYHSVELQIEGLTFPYQFKLRKNSSKSMHFIVHENSDVLRGLQVGKTFDMKYYSDDFFRTAKVIKTEIMNISKVHEGKFRGHYVVDLSIMNNQKGIMTH